MGEELGMIKGLTKKDHGHIASLLQALRDSPGWSHLEVDAANILTFMVLRWHRYGLTEWPDVQVACENLDVDGWLQAGSPTYSTAQTE
jgi:hypothetical protein